jgi:D-arabinose 1-dehydrogenase-like Zn-dependent alcohol dehydrogenase
MAVCEFMRAKASHALKIPQSLDSAEAAAVLRRRHRLPGAAQCRRRPGQRVAVFGSAVSATSRCRSPLRSAPEVYGFDVNPAKLALARELGAASTFDVTDPDTVKAVRKLAACMPRS